jgi:hypothetical protein
MEAVMQHPINVKNFRQTSPVNKGSLAFAVRQLKELFNLLFPRRPYHSTDEDCP